MEEFPQPEVLEPIMATLREAIGSNDHKAIVNLFNSHVEGYYNAS